MVEKNRGDYFVSQSDGWSSRKNPGDDRLWRARRTGRRCHLIADTHLKNLQYSLARPDGKMALKRSEKEQQNI
jgi:hypothetical protein